MGQPDSAEYQVLPLFFFLIFFKLWKGLPYLLASAAMPERPELRLSGLQSELDGVLPTQGSDLNARDEKDYHIHMLYKEETKYALLSPI